MPLSLAPPESLSSWLLSPSAARMAVVALGVATATIHAASSPELLRVGQVLPRLEGEFLSGRKATLPAASEGKVALVMIGFTYESRHPVEAWGGWFRKMTGRNAAVTSFEVPMIGGMARLGKWFIDSGMRKGTPVELHENVITVYSGSGDWKRRMGVSSSNENDAFLVLVDQQGVVRWLHHGAFDAARAEDLTRVIAALGVGEAAATGSGQQR
jgi:hypothetical protein